MQEPETLPEHFPAAATACDIGGAKLYAGENLEDFLTAVQQRAWRMAWLVTRNREEALDLVQDTMMRFVQKYRDKPATERRPLFYRMLNNRIRDWGRRQQVRRRWVMPWLRFTTDESSQEHSWEPPDPGPGPQRHSEGDDFRQAVEAALTRLPPRQREAFLLREWEGLDIAGTARAMGVSPGSVKTHYFRAVHSLRATLEDYR